jgi:signal transduction histidine kinase
MTDAERVLSLLIHDLRTPLGVAHGYLRLIRADRLPSAEDRDRALAGTQEALARMSRLCQDAGAFLDDAPPAAGQAPATMLAERVLAALAERGVAVAERDAGDRGPARDDRQVAVGISLDRAADAIATLLATRAGRAANAVASVDVTPTALRFACGPAADGRTTPVQLDGDERPFDPWQSSQGLSVILAHRLVTTLGGRVWMAGDGLALALSMPMESGAA